jgi:hypothetical protein
MDKKEVLDRARAEGSDEGEKWVEGKGYEYGAIGFGAMYIIVMIFNWVTGQDNYLPMALFFAFLGAQEYGKYRASGDKGHRANTILTLIASVGFLACYVIRVLGIHA